MNEPPKRRWYQFNLRSLLIVAALLCVVVDRARLIKERDDALRQAIDLKSAQGEYETDQRLTALKYDQVMRQLRQVQGKKTN
jgi:hypothetical protein